MALFFEPVLIISDNIFFFFFLKIFFLLLNIYLIFSFLFCFVFNFLRGGDSPQIFYILAFLLLYVIFKVEK